MRNVLHTVVRRSQYIIASLVLASTGLLIAGVNMVAQPQIAQAASNCPYDASFPETNIAFCGVWQQNGSNATLAQDISSLQNLYSTGTDSCTGAGTGNDGATCQTATDLTKVMNAFYSNAGSIIPGMSATDGNTMLAVSCKDGTLRTSSCNGTVLGTNMRIGARWNLPGNSDFQQILGHVYTHSPSTFFSDDFSAVPTLVHMNPSTGTVDFAIWLPCANVITVTPVKPQQTIVCDFLHATPAANSVTDFTFDAQGHTQNTTISTFTFDFGDNSQKLIVNAQPGSSADVFVANNIKHSYVQTTSQQTFTAKVFVNDTTTTPDTCQVQITIPPKQQESSFSCKSLQAPSTLAVNQTGTFVITANAMNVQIKTYNFDYGDGTVNHVATPTDTHSFATAGTHTVTASVTTTTGATSDIIPACTASVSTPQPPTALVNAGPGSIFGLFAVTAAAGALFHRFVLRKKFIA